MKYDKSHILTPAKIIELRKNQKLDFQPQSVNDAVMKGSGFNVKEIYAGVEETVIERSLTQEFEFDGFSVVVDEAGSFYVQFEDSEDGLVVQALVDEGENEARFPYLFDVDGVEKVLTEEEYLRIKTFIDGAKE